MKRSGSLLIVTLWLVTILSVLAVAIARYLSLGVKVSRYRIAREQAKALARGGVYISMQRLAIDGAAPEADGKTYDWPGDNWAVTDAALENDPAAWSAAVPGSGATDAGLQGRLTVRLTDEDRKLNVNTADQAQLASVAGDPLAQAILDARDAPDPAEDRPGTEPPYFAKNGPFRAAEELADLPGMTAEAYAALRSSTTPYLDGSAGVNLNTAPPDVLRALGLTETTIQMIERFRTGSDGPNEHAQDGVFTEAGIAIVQLLKDHEGVDLTGTDDGNLLSGPAFGVSSQTFMISAEGAIAHPAVRVRVEAVVRRAPCPAGGPTPCIIAWREGV